MTDRTLSGLANEVAFDRDVGTEDAWWRDRIGDYLRDMPESDQEDADKRRIIRVPKLERALMGAICQRDEIAALRERNAACFVAAMKRLTAAADAWSAFKQANTTDDHFAAVAALDAALDEDARHG
jgi:hypothetical protein